MFAFLRLLAGGIKCLTAALMASNPATALSTAAIAGAAYLLLEIVRTVAS